MGGPNVDTEGGPGIEHLSVSIWSIDQPLVSAHLLSCAVFSSPCPRPSSSLPTQPSLDGLTVLFALLYPFAA